MKTSGLYIHFPFCKRVCYYCHFTKQKFDRVLSEKYISYLLKELSLKADKGKTIDTIFFGGGSPGLINPEGIRRIFKSILENFNINDSCETTIEINPEDAGLEKLKFFKDAGFNRISIGTQSFESRDLEFLKRDHSATLSISVIEDVKKAGFTNINADFIIGLPGQKKETLSRGFNIVKNFDIPHLSVYVLEGIKEDNDEENRYDESLYFQSESILNKLGYNRYEVSNYARQGFESNHNNKYWKGEDYIGVGVSASGFENGIDYKNTESLDEYCKLIDEGKLPIKEKREIDPIERTIITGLRRTEGIEKKYFAKHKDKLELLLNEKILKETGKTISVSPDKILLLNEILTYFR